MSATARLHHRVWLALALLGWFGAAKKVPVARAWRQRGVGWMLDIRGGDAVIQEEETATDLSRGAFSRNDSAVAVVDGDSRNTTIRIPTWKVALPEQLRKKGPKTLQKIRLGTTDIFLLGTAHVSNDSSADVRLLLNAVHPDCVFVELCEGRIPLMVGKEDDDGEVEIPAKNASFFERLRTTQDAQGGSRLQALSTILLTSVQEDYATELGVELGGEFRCAHDFWKNRTYRVHLVLGDRPLYLTLVRAWESLWWWPKIKIMAGLLWSSLRKPNKDEIRQWLDSVMEEESDVLTESFVELRRHFPTLYTTIISERDAWLAAKLTQTCRALQQRPHDTADATTPTTTVVAIVGAGHVPGICQWLTHPPETKSPEEVLKGLVKTKRWAKDETVQKEAIPMWISEVTEMQDSMH